MTASPETAEQRRARVAAEHGGQGGSVGTVVVEREWLREQALKRRSRVLRHLRRPHTPER